MPLNRNNVGVMLQSKAVAFAAFSGSPLGAT